MNSRRYRLDRIARELELEASAARRRINEITREQALATAAVECAELLGLFAACPAQGWLRLSQLTPQQRVGLAINMAIYLERRGKAIAWGLILDRWETRLGELEADAAEMLRLGGLRGDGPEVCEPEAERPDVPMVEMPSATTAGVWYRVAVDGSYCSCPGFFYRGACRHAREMAEAVVFDPRIDAEPRWAA